MDVSPLVLSLSTAATGSRRHLQHWPPKPDCCWRSGCCDGATGPGRGRARARPPKDDVPTFTLCSTEKGFSEPRRPFLWRKSNVQGRGGRDQGTLSTLQSEEDSEEERRSVDLMARTDVVWGETQKDMYCISRRQDWGRTLVLSAVLLRLQDSVQTWLSREGLFFFYNITFVTDSKNNDYNKLVFNFDSVGADFLPLGSWLKLLLVKIN